MRSLYFLSFLIGGASLFGAVSAKNSWAMDIAEEALLRDSAENDKEGEEANYQRHFRHQEEARVLEEESKRKISKSGPQQSPDVTAYLAAHKGAKTSLTPPPTLLGEMGESDPMPTLSPEESQKAGQAQLQAQLQNAQHHHAQDTQNKSFVLGIDPHQKISNRYFQPQGTSAGIQNAAASYGNNMSAKWKSQLPGMTIDELLGETRGSLIDALELCPPSAEENYRLENCLKHHSPPEWWTADLKRSEPKLLVEKWKALKTIPLKKTDDPLEIYANWLAEMIPEEFKDRHHPEFISALIKPQPVKMVKAQEGVLVPPPAQVLAPPPLNLAEAKAALEGGLQKPQAIPSLTEEKAISHQKQEHLAEKATESYIGEDNAQYLYPVTAEGKPSSHAGALQETAQKPVKRTHADLPPIAGVEAYRDEE
ncbi:hypothetical protein FAI41_03510 [Acetobacteraceae bacterium]|nr:hypothetical protein FAI41_03510 [Acetobacteraceae bacterium]